MSKWRRRPAKYSVQLASELRGERTLARPRGAAARGLDLRDLARQALGALAEFEQAQAAIGDERHHLAQRRNVGVREQGHAPDCRNIDVPVPAPGGPREIPQKCAGRCKAME